MHANENEIFQLVETSEILSTNPVVFYFFYTFFLRHV